MAMHMLVETGLLAQDIFLQRESGLYALADAVERAAGSVIMTTSHGFPSVGITMAGGSAQRAFAEYWPQPKRHCCLSHPICQ